MKRMKKDFSAANLDPMFAAATQKATAPAPVKEELPATKGARINFALTAENHAFVKTMARAAGVSMADYINSIIEAYRTEHSETYTAIVDMRQHL